MNTQISKLRSGTKNQILNPEIDYSQFPQATSHVGHSGSNRTDVQEIWENVVSENPKSIRAIIKGVEVYLKANWSVSGKTVSYCGTISKEDLEDKFCLRAAKKEQPTISIQSGSDIIVSNGKKSYIHICPSLVKIL